MANPAEQLHENLAFLRTETIFNNQSMMLGDVIFKFLPSPVRLCEVNLQAIRKIMWDHLQWQTSHPEIYTTICKEDLVWSDILELRKRFEILLGLHMWQNRDNTIETPTS